MKPYLTILLDSFRMLKARAIFWVTLGISLFVALIYLSIGFDEKGMSFFFGLSHFESDNFRAGTSASETLYVAIFTKLIAEYWLSWIAVLLGLISCAAIFPDALKEGVAGMILTKKLSRIQVFLAKFVGSLLFVTIQVVIFVAIVFVAMRWRLGSWNPSVFWCVPLILLVFTYLYSFMMVIAVKTKSVMTALILTLVLWFVSSIVGVIEGQLYEGIQMTEMMDESRGVVDQQAQAAQVQVIPNGEEVPIEEDRDPEVVEELQATESERSTSSSTLKLWHKRMVAVYAVFPKTGRTMEVADRLLVINGKKGIAKGSFSVIMMRLAFEGDEGDDEYLEVSEKSADRHSTGYAIGTSLIFALVMLVLAAWIFCRKEI
jgi:ABC-type transport system involved in multi-copper enzyme maturation permease subunit